MDINKKSNLAGFILIYQLFPLALIVWVLKFTNNPSLLAVAGMLVLSELILFSILYNWKKTKLSMLDERERLIRLQVQSLISRVTEVSLAGTILIYLLLYREMPTLLALMMVGVPGVLAQCYGNYKFRKL